MSKNERRKPYEFSVETKQEAIRRRGNVCEGCGKPGSKAKLEADHIIPIFFARRYPVFALEVIKSLSNCRILCRECHDKRMHYEESEILMLAHGVLNNFIQEQKNEIYGNQVRP